MLDLKVFKSIPFFENFSDELIDVVNTVSRLDKIGNNEFLLEQGALNTNLYFLVKGSVDVIVDDVQVLEVASNGQVFGEMSIVSHDLCAATVKTKSECYILTIAIKDLYNLPDQYKNAVLKDVYKSCAEILAKKLVETNQIAKSYKSLLK